MLRIKPFEKRTALKVARDPPELGESVVAIGSPEGLTNTTSTGIVSSIRVGSEVREMLPRGLYAKLGYSLTAKWIQHTAAISHGSSGGPLVNFRGELIGLNTWGLPVGQNLNYAVGTLDIRRLMGEPVSKSATGTARRPQASPESGDAKRPLNEKPGGHPPAEQDPPLKVVTDPFPSGRVYSPPYFDLPTQIDWQGAPIVMTHHNGSLFAIASHNAGKLHGVTVAQHENKKPMVYVSYHEGKRQGLLETWNEQGEPVLFTQYAKGKRDGFSCFFDDGRLCMITEYRQEGKVKCIRLISGVRVVGEFASKGEADDDSVGHERLVALKKVEDALDANERKFKEQVVKIVSPTKTAIRREYDSQVAATLDRAASAQQAELQRVVNSSTRAWQSTYVSPGLIK